MDNIENAEPVIRNAKSDDIENAEPVIRNAESDDIENAEPATIENTEPVSIKSAEPAVTMNAETAANIDKEIRFFIQHDSLLNKDDDFLQWLLEEPEEEEVVLEESEGELKEILNTYGYTPPLRPDGWACDPCWHIDTVLEIPLEEEKEEKRGNKRKRKVKPRNTIFFEEKGGKALEETTIIEIKNQNINLASLNHRTRNSQPSTIFQLPPEKLTLYIHYTESQVQNGLIIQDHTKTVLVHLFPRNTLSSHLISTLESSWETYESTVPFPTTGNSSLNHRRGNYVSRVLGCWFKSGRFLQPYMTANYRGPGTGHHYKRKDNPFYMGARQFQHSNNKLFIFIENLIKVHHPVMYKIYQDIKVPEGCHKFAGLFAAAFINKLVTTTAHKDLGDIKGGICIVICWGKFTGGNLVFTELTSVVPFLSGSIIMFRSSVITHYNLPVEGERYSMVLMTDKRLKMWSDRQKS